MKIYQLSEVPFNQDWPYHQDNNSTPNTETMHSDMSFKELSNKIPNDVSNFLEQMFPNAKPFGAGSFGIAYDIGDNKILKITVHGSEATSAAHIKNTPEKRLPLIYDIIPIHKYLNYSSTPHYIWGIVMEKLKPLNTLESQVFDWARNYKSSFDTHFIREQILKLQTFDDAINFFSQQQQYPFRYQTLEGLSLPPNQKLYIIKEFVLFLHDMSLTKYKLVDIQSSNVGWRKNYLVQLDLGFLHN